MVNTFATYKIGDRSMVPFIKREIHNLVLQHGFSAHRAAEVDIVVSELTSNLIKYAAEGEMLYRVQQDGIGHALEIYCMDRGAGIRNVARYMNDGVSTGGSLGQGLGAIKRLSSDFQIYSMPSWGTVQYVRMELQADANWAQDRFDLDYDVIATPHPNEAACGDGFGVKKTETGFQVLVADGLGHGEHAQEAAQRATQAFYDCKDSDPVAILRVMHEATKKSRGLVATVATADFTHASWSVCGVGNISTRIYTGLQAKTYTPYNGILGHNVPRTMNSTVAPLEKHQVLVMHSDGLRTRWNLNELLSIMKHSPGIIASSIYKESLRGTDDALILVGKIN
jgi:anti-sigma regulatory factor (Ser/Thr protein kinase)